jgi:hypothetical protein
MYFDPEALGLVSVSKLDRTSYSYSFDYADVWYRPEDGFFYAATDSGCSCPSPYEGFQSLSDLEGPFTRASAMDWMRRQDCENPVDRIDAVEDIRNYDKPR